MKASIMDAVLFKRWLFEKRNLAEATVKCYVMGIERFLSFNPDIDIIEDYNRFLVKFAIKKRCPFYYSVLKSFIEYKITDSSLRHKLIDDLILPPLPKDIKRERKYLDITEVLDVINHLTMHKHKVIALVQGITGVRAGDILRLKRDNIIPEIYKGNKVLRLNVLGKGKKRNVIFIHDKLIQQIVMNYITTHQNIDDYYFLEKGNIKNREGNMNSEYDLMKMNYWWYWTDLKKAIHTCGYNKEDFSTHDFRRCFARRVWEKYKDIYVLQNMLNHSDPKVTLGYLAQSGLKNIDYHKDMQIG